MRIYVCVKQVPDTSGKVAVNPDGTLNRASMATIINPDDLSAMEQALRIKDATGCQVTAVTMGPPPAEGMLRELIAMGADDAILISAREFGGSDTFATSQIIAAGISKSGLTEEDIIFCGRQAIDGDTAQVGPQIAEKLDIPQVSYAAEIQKTGNTLKIKRMLEDGYMTIEVKTPCLLTCIKELNKPRYKTVRGVLEFDQKPLNVFDFETLKDETGCEVIVVTMGPPPAEGMLRELIAMGADRGVLVSGREFGGSDTFATSQIIAAGINAIGLEEDDIVFCGRQAIDGDTAQVGPQIAEKLNIPQISYAADIKVEGKKVTVKRMLEDGYMTIETQTPCLVTCIKELNEPRYMSVAGIVGAYSKPMDVMDYPRLKDDPLIEVDTIGLAGSPTNILTSFTPPQKGAGMMLEGADKATCEQLASILVKKHII